MQYDKYVGIPYKDKGRDTAGVDCWGLTRLIYADKYGIALPTFSDDYIVHDNERIADLTSMYSEGWEKKDTPSEGDVVLFRILGHNSHMGVMINEKQFIHTTRNVDVCIDSLESVKWARRIAGFYRYTEAAEKTFNNIPKELTKIPYRVRIEDGTTVKDIRASIIRDTKEYKDLNIVVFVNNELVYNNDYVVRAGDRVEFRVIPTDDKTMRTIATIAIIIFATAVAGPAGAEYAAFTLEMGAVGSAAVGYGVTMATIYVGMQLVDQIFPIRPPEGPTDPGNPGSSNPMLMFNGSRNEARPYGTIPLVLGRYRFIAPLAGETFAELNTDLAYLRMLICWGYGPLQINDLKIGPTPLESYEDVTHYTITGSQYDDKAKLLANYGQDVKTVTISSELQKTDNPEDDWQYRVINQPCTKVLSNLYFPEGLRGIYREGTSAGSVFPVEFKAEVQLRLLDSNLNPITGWQAPVSTVLGATFNLPNTWNRLTGAIKTSVYGVGPCYSWSTIYIGQGGALQISNWISFANKADVTAQSAGEYVAGFEAPSTWVGLTYANVFPPPLPAGAQPLLHIRQYTSSPSNNTIDTIVDARTTTVIPAASYASAVSNVANITVNTFNIPGSQDSLINLGLAGESFYLRKDAFTYTNTFVIPSEQAAPCEVRIRRLTTTNGDLDGVAGKPYYYFKSIWSSLQGINTDIDPYYNPLGSNLALTSVRIKATDQLNGSVEAITAECTTIAKDYVSGTTQITASGTSGTNVLTRTVSATATDTSDVSLLAQGSSITGPGIQIDTTITQVVVVRTNSVVDSGGQIITPGTTVYTFTLSKNLTSTLTNATVTVGLIGWTPRPTRNPASLYLHVLQHPANAQRILDADLANKVDLAALADWHQYCSINNFTYDAVIAEQRSLLEVMKDICAAGRASPLLVNGKWTVVIDRPRTVITQHFTPHNSWEFSSSKGLGTPPHALRITFINSAKEYQSEDIYEYMPGYDSGNATLFEAIQIPGVTVAETVRKHARYHLAQAKLRPETYSLHTDIENLVCTRGDLVRVTHDVPMWGNASGRISEVIATDGSSTTIRLEDDVLLEDSNTYVIRIRTETGASVVRTIDTVATGYYREITVRPALSEVESKKDNLYLLGLNNKESTELIILGIESLNNYSAKLTLTDYSPAVYLVDSEPLPPFETNITQVGNYQRNRIVSVPVISNIRSDESVMEKSGSVYIFKMSISYTANTTLEPNAQYVQCRMCLKDDTAASWRHLQEVPIAAGNLVFSDLLEGVEYVVQLRYTSSDGIAGPWSDEVVHEVVGRQTPPPDISNFAISGNALSWETVSGIDMLGYIIKFNYGNNTDWNNATALHNGFLTSTPHNMVFRPAGECTIMIKAIDSLYNESVNPAIIITNLGDANAANPVQSFDFSGGGYQGTVTGATVIGTSLEATVNNSDPFYGGDSESFYSADIDSLYSENVYNSVYYETNVVQVTSTLPGLQGIIQFEYSGQGAVLEYARLSDAPLYPDPGSQMFYKSPGDQPFYGELVWVGCPAVMPISPGYYKFRCRLAGGTTKGVVSNLKLLVDAPDQIEYIEDVAISASGTVVPYTVSFNDIKQVMVTLQANASGGVRVEVDKTVSMSPIIYVYNSANVPVSGALVDILVKGY